MTTFMLLSLVLCAAGAPLFGTVQFLTTRNWRDVALPVASWVGIAIVYWWPLGAWLFRGPRRAWVRVPLGYLLSIPLYFLALTLAYAALGYRFAPRDGATWGIYLSASPWFYLYVLALWQIARRPLVQRWSLPGAIAIAVVAIIVPVVLLTSIDRGRPSGTSVSRIVNVRIVDPVDGLLPGLHTIRIAGGAIASIDDNGSGAAANGRIVDGHGAFLAPGLIDVHAHLQTPAAIVTSFSFAYAGTELFGAYRDHRRQYLASGVTSVRDTGGAASVSAYLRGELAAHRLAGPRLFTVGRLITSPGGHPADTIWSRSLAAAGAIQARDRATLLQAIDEDVTRYRPDAVKVVFGTIGRARTRLDETLLTATLDAAKRHGLPSVVHAETVDEVSAAVRAGATGVEHGASIGSLPDDLRALLIARRPFVDATFGEYRFLLAQRGTPPLELDAALSTARGIVARLADGQVPLVVGTDAPLVRYGSGLHDELDQLRQAGLSPADILKIATVNNAAYLGVSTLGRVARGFKADLILTAANPLKTLDTLRHPLLTMVDGVVMWETPDASGR